MAQLTRDQEIVGRWLLGQLSEKTSEDKDFQAMVEHYKPVGASLGSEDI